MFRTKRALGGCKLITISHKFMFVPTGEIITQIITSIGNSKFLSRPSSPSSSSCVLLTYNANLRHPSYVDTKYTFWISFFQEMCTHYRIKLQNYHFVNPTHLLQKIRIGQIQLIYIF